MVEFRIDCALAGGILPGDRWFVQTHDDTCSRCSKPIPEDDVPLLIWADKGNRMLAYCTKCQEKPDEPNHGNRSNGADRPALRLVRGHDCGADQARGPGAQAGGDAEGAPEVLTDDFLIWSNEFQRFWGPAFNGYTPVISRAGRYKLDEATIICTNYNGHLRPTDEPSVVMLLAPEQLPAIVAVANRPGITEDLAAG